MAEPRTAELARFEREAMATHAKIAPRSDDERIALQAIDDLREAPNRFHPDLGLIPVYDPGNSRASRTRFVRRHPELFLDW